MTINRTLARTTLAVAAVLAATVVVLPIADARDRSGHGSGMGHTGVPRPTTGNTLGGKPLGGKPLAGKGADIGQWSGPMSVDKPVYSRRDRRGQPQPKVSPPPQGVPHVSNNRMIRVCDAQGFCRVRPPFGESEKMRAQVRDHRNR
jgi:hypothetical protein